MKEKLTPAVKSAIRAIDVLEFVAAEANPSTFAQIGKALGVPKSSLFYLLNTLCQRGYLQQENGKGAYRLGPALAMLIKSSVSQVSWAQLTQPLIEYVWDRVQETTSYFERRGDEMECLVCKLAPHTLVSFHRVGQIVPIYSVSGGKVILADFSKEEFEQYITRVPLQRLTPHTLSSAAALRRDIAHVKRTGFGVSREENTLGVIGISIGLRTRVGIIGTLGVAMPTVRFNKKIETKIRNELIAASRLLREIRLDNQVQ